MDSPVVTQVLKTRLFVIEHQRLLREALHSILVADERFALVGESDGLDIEKLGSVQHDILLIDCDPYGLNVRQIVYSIRSANVGSKICVLSTYADPTVVANALSAGADGYILKDVAPSEFRTALRAISEAGFYLDPRLTRSVFYNATSRGERSSSELTMRELDVVRLIARGLSNRQIAQELHLSEKTIKNHVANVFVKLGFTARSQLAVHAVRHGLTGTAPNSSFEPALAGTSSL